MYVSKTVESRFASSRSPEEMLAADILAAPRCIQNTKGRTVGHHHVDGREVRDGVLGNGYGVGRTLVRRVVAVRVVVVGEGPVAELWLVLRCVDLVLSDIAGLVRVHLV